MKIKVNVGDKIIFKFHNCIIGKMTNETGVITELRDCGATVETLKGVVDVVEKQIIAKHDHVDGKFQAILPFRGVYKVLREGDNEEISKAN